MSAIDQVLTGYGWQNGDLDQSRSELAQLRAEAAERDELRATVQAQRVQIALLDDYAETIRQHEVTITAQAAQLDQAREVILKYRSLKLGPRGFCSENLFEHHNLADEWLAANAPQDVKA